MEAPILRVITQRHQSDCSVACLAMVCGVSYENALVAVAGDAPDVCVTGVYTQHLRNAARRLGFRLRTQRRVYLDSDTGILNVRRDDWEHTHLVVLKSGLIVDTDATIWDADVYVEANRIDVEAGGVGPLYVLELVRGEHAAGRARGQGRRQ